MKFFSYIIVAVISVAAALLFSNMSTDPSEVDFQGVDINYEEQEATGYKSYYSQLTDVQKKIYEAIKAAVAEGNTEVKLKNVPSTSINDNIKKAIMAVHYDCPEYFWFRCAYGGNTEKERFAETMDAEVNLYFYEYATSMYKYGSKLQELKEAVDKVATLARESSSDPYEQIVFVHDYLIENAYYDHDDLEEYYKTSHSPSSEYIFSAYGCLVRGKTVCSGYAKAFQLVMRELGFDCSYVTGEAGEPHGWNCLYIDGEGYFVDVTWDDYDLEKEAPFYNYALITSEALSKTHTIDKDFEVPVCNSKEYNYFIKKGYYAEKYSFDKAYEILSAQVGEDAIHIQFGSIKELKNAYEELVEKGKYEKIPGCIDYEKCLAGEEHYVLSFINEK